MFQLLNNWQLYLGGSVALLGAASYFLGIGAILRIVASVSEVIAPLLRGLMEAIVEWTKIMWEGFKDILDSWKTVLTVLTLLAVAYGTAKVPAKIDELECRQQIEALKKRIPKATPKQSTTEWRWFWE